MQNKYIILTGSKNNAGDFLIKFRAKELFKELRNDREIIDYNAWEELDEEKIKNINSSKALLLMGGPSLQFNMKPNVYRLTNNLHDINVPIITMGIGWMSMSGRWKDTYNYKFNRESIELLDRINNSGYLSSVRDYHTLNVLRFKKFDKFIMTGCPAYYDITTLTANSNVIKPINKVAYSLGVSFVNSKSMENLMKENILQLKDFFKDKEFEVVFHHSLNKDIFLSTHSYTKNHFTKHIEFANWLEDQNISYVDISGSAENLMSYYYNVDLHIGYRVHAHIFMNSISKLSILISEDGRSKATKDVIGGIVLDAYEDYKITPTAKILKKIFNKFDRYKANKNLTFDLLYNLDYEIKTDFNRIKLSEAGIKSNYSRMKFFIEQLP